MSELVRRVLEFPSAVPAPHDDADLDAAHGLIAVFLRATLDEARSPFLEDLIACFARSGERPVVAIENADERSSVELSPPYRECFAAVRRAIGARRGWRETRYAQVSMADSRDLVIACGIHAGESAEGYAPCTMDVRFEFAAAHSSVTLRRCTVRIETFLTRVADDACPTLAAA